MATPSTVYPVGSQAISGTIASAGTQHTSTQSATIQGSSATFGNITTSTTRPYTLADMDVDTAMTLTAINKKLQIEATLDDIWAEVGADVVFTGKKVMVPDAVVMKLKTGTKGEHKQVIPIMSPLSGPGRGGTTEDQTGFERGLVMRFMEAYYNEYSQALAGEEWGVNFNQLQLFDYYGQIQPMLSKWFKEDDGLQYRQASLETYSWPLTKAGTADIATGLTPVLNSNFFIANTEPGSQPAWSSTEATYVNNIATACAAADGGTNGAYANIDLDTLIAIDDYAQNTKRLTPVTIGGKSSYLLVLPSPQYKKLIQTKDGQLGSVWEKVSALTQEEQNFPGIVGRVLSLVIIEDQRYPTITFDNYNSGAAMTIEYVYPGNDDGRNKTIYSSSSNLSWDVAFLYGAPALIDWEVTPLHFEMEKQNYGKDYGKGAFRERGVQLCRYTNDTGNVNVNYGSMACLFTATSLISVA